MDVSSIEVPSSVTSVFVSSWQKWSMKKDEDMSQNLESIVEVGNHAKVEVRQSTSEDEPHAG